MYVRHNSSHFLCITDINVDNKYRNCNVSFNLTSDLKIEIRSLVNDRNASKIRFKQRKKKDLKLNLKLSKFPYHKRESM